MNTFAPPRTATLTHPGKRKLSRDTVVLIGDLLPLCDFAAVLLAGYLASLLYTGWIAPGTALSGVLAEGGRAALAAAVLAPFILCDRVFVAFASSGQNLALVRCYAVRFMMFAGVVAAIGMSSRSLQTLPAAWLATGLAGTLLITALTRLLLVKTLRHLEREGTLVETVAVVGSGPAADQLIDRLRQSHGSRIEVVGAFADPVTRLMRGVQAPDRSINALIELGKTRALDWILLAPADTDDLPLQSIVHRLKALDVPIGLWPQHAGLEAIRQSIRPFDNNLPVTLLADPGRSVWQDLLKFAYSVLPGWIITLFSLPLSILRLLLARLQQAADSSRRPRAPKLQCALDDYDLDSFSALAARFGQRRFGYVVTPNADHMIRLHQQASFRALYADAAYVLLDSRFIAQLLRWTRKPRLPVCTGSDLTAKLFADIIVPADRVVLIGGSEQQAVQLRQRHGLAHLAHFNPPMGFIHDADAVEHCLRFVEKHSPFRFCLLAVGAPQQEMLAQALKHRGKARGMALCIGASINFLTGGEKRAPRWVQACGMEWLYRLLQAPGRMAGRYLVRGPQIFGLLRQTDFVLRARTELKRGFIESLFTPEHIRSSSHPEPVRMPATSRPPIPNPGSLPSQHAVQ